MATRPTVTEDQIRARVGDGAFARAQEYVREGAVFDARRQGDTLRGRCEGSHAESYHVRAALHAGGAVTDAACTCPVGGAGQCKHVAALLLTWRERPGDFLEVEDVETALRRRSKAELAALVRQMLLQQPDLESLLVTPLPGGRAGAGGGLRGVLGGAKVYRRQADAVFRRNGAEWGAVVAITEELRALRAIGDGFVAQGDAAAATAVYEGLAEAVLDRYPDYAKQDEEGALRGLVGDCVAGLGRCLDAAAAGAEAGAEAGADGGVRENILRVLVEIYEADAELGDVGPGDDVPDLILKHATAAERHRVAGWLRALSPASAAWPERAYANFLLDLTAETLTDEEYLAACRDLGRHRDRVERLLRLGRPDEAVAVAREAGAYDLLAVANLLVQHCHEAAAEALVRERAAEAPELPWLEWLVGRSAARGDRAETLALAVRLFGAAPSLARYREARGLAQALGRWEALRPQLLAAAAERPGSHLLTEIHLDEGAIDAALERVKGERTVDPVLRSLGGGIRLRVAEAAEAPRPRAALDIYRQHVADLIAVGARPSYQEAVRYLKKIRALMEALGEAEGWAGYVAELRERHGRLRALRDEMTAAGL